MERFLVESVGESEGASGQEFAGTAMRVRLPRAGQDRVGVGVLGPQGAQDEDRPAVRVGEQRV